MTNCGSSCCKRRRTTGSDLSPISFRRKCIVFSRLCQGAKNEGVITMKRPERRQLHLRKTEGVQISKCSSSEEVTINNNVRPFRLCHWNDSNLKSPRRTNWRARLVPAAAVIPAPIAYIKVVAVKKLVVGFQGTQ